MFPAANSEDMLARIVTMPDRATFTFVLLHEHITRRPNIGDYVIVTTNIYSVEDPEKWLAVVMEVREIVLDENEIEVKNLLAVDEIGEAERKRYFATEYTCKLIGMFYMGSIKPYPRYLPYRTAMVRYPTIEELKEIVSIDSGGFRIGELIIGGIKVATQDQSVGIKYIPFRFNLERLDNKRTAVFGQSGYGKSNLTKTLITGYALYNPRKGICIFDRSGEYINESEWSKSLSEVKPLTGEGNTPLGNDTGVKERGRIIAIDVSRVRVDLREIEGEKIVEFFMTERDVTRVGVEYFAYFSEEDKVKIIESIAEWGNNRDDTRKFEECKNILKNALKNVGASNIEKMLPSLLRILRRVVRQYHTPNSPIPKELLRWIREGKIVVFNLANVSDDIINRLTRFIVNEVIESNSLDYINQRTPTECLFLIEEAQNFLSPEQIKESTDPVVRLAKEGRKYKLGLIYVTQQPGAIDDSILSQTNNFFVMHLLANQDVRKLCNVAPQYELVADNIQQEPARGVAYIYSNVYEGILKPFPLVISAEIENFNNVVAVVNSKPSIFVKPANTKVEVEEAFLNVVKELVEVNETVSIVWQDFWRRVNKLIPDGNPYKNNYGKGKPYPDIRIISALEEKFSVIKIDNKEYKITPVKNEKGLTERYVIQLINMMDVE